MLLLNLAISRPTGYTSNPERQALVSIISVLRIGVTFFLALFLALQGKALIAARERRASRAGRLARLDAELALLVAPPGHAAPGRDDALVAALFALQAAVGRYNDLVLTNALVLADGRDDPLAAAAAAYRQELEGAAAQVRRLLAAG